MTALAVVDRTSEVTHFAEACEWTGVMSDDRDAWLAVRRQYLTASDMAAVMGHDTRKSAFQVWVDKTAELVAINPSFHSPMFWGSALEWPLAEIAAKEYGWGITRGGALLRSRRFPKLAATLDAEVEIKSIWVNYEGKNTSEFLRRDWDELEQEPPTRVLLQAQEQLLVTDAPYAVVFCLIGGNKPVKIRVDPHLEVQGAMVQRADWFLDLVERRIPPPVTASDQRALEQLYPANDGSIVRLPPEAREWTERIAAIAANQKALEKEDALLRNKLRQCIGKATWGVLEEPVERKRYWRWETQQRREYTVEASSSRVLSRLIKGPRVDHMFDALPVGQPENLEQSLTASLAMFDKPEGVFGELPPAEPEIVETSMADLDRLEVEAQLAELDRLETDEVAALAEPTASPPTAPLGAPRKAPAPDAAVPPRKRKRARR